MPELEFTLYPVGFVRSPLEHLADAPMQGNEGAPDAWLEVDPALVEGLDGLAVGDKIIVVTWFHRARRDILKLHPRDDNLCQQPQNLPQRRGDAEKNNKKPLYLCASVVKINQR